MNPGQEHTTRTFYVECYEKRTTGKCTQKCTGESIRLEKKDLEEAGLFKLAALMDEDSHITFTGINDETRAYDQEFPPLGQ